MVNSPWFSYRSWESRRNGFLSKCKGEQIKTIYLMRNIYIEILLLFILLNVTKSPRVINNFSPSTIIWLLCNLSPGQSCPTKTTEGNANSTISIVLRGKGGEGGGIQVSEEGRKAHLSLRDNQSSSGVVTFPLSPFPIPQAQIFLEGQCWTLPLHVGP